MAQETTVPDTFSPSFSALKVRPLSITVLAWFFIVGDIFMIVQFTLNVIDPRTREIIITNSAFPLSLTCAIAYLTFSVQLIAGIAFLKARNWGRYLYLSWQFVTFSVTVVFEPTRLAHATTVISLFVMAIVVFLLFRPKANQYFCTLENDKGNGEKEAPGAIFRGAR